MSQDTVLQEFRERRTRERAKAVAKCGTAGMAPGGDPKRDVFDYATNECTGLLRYAEMIEVRLRGYDLPESLREEAISICRQLAASGSRHALDLIDLRQRLQKLGIELGRPEAA